MERTIGAYRLLTPLKTAGSGSARWAIAVRGGERFFLKEFLSPVFPVAGGKPDLRQKQIERCRRFEGRKQRLYSAMSLVIGDTLVPVLDFFRYDGRYYSVSEEVSQELSGSKDPDLTAREKRQLLLNLALCLQRLHMQDIVHADLKPDHVLIRKGFAGCEARLIDLDSGFLLNEPPSPREMEGDPVYLAPEAFLRMAGQEIPLTTAIDTFAFGAMIHWFWAGCLPRIDGKYAYLYEAALDGAPIHLSRALPADYRDTVQRMLSADPAQRPSDGELVRLLSLAQNEDEPEQPQPRQDRPLNGLSRFMKKER